MSGTGTNHGTLQTAQSASWSYSGAWAADEAAGGCDIGMLELFWDRIETSQGNFNAGQLSAITSQMNDLKNLRGFKVSIGLGLHYPPAWVDTLLGTVHKFKNQAGTVDAADDMVWNQAVRDLAASYITRILDHVGVDNIWSIRVTSGGFSELLFPNGSGYWGYSAAALGTGLAVGQTANPEPTWVAGTTHPGGTPGVQTWTDWYLQSLANTAVWQMDVCDAAGHTGWYEIPCPGSGAHTNGVASAVAANLPVGNILRRGAAWREIMQKIPQERRARTVFLQSGTADTSGGTTAWIPQHSDKTTDLSGSAADAWGSARWMAACAYEQGYLVGGENPGFGAVTNAYYQGTGSTTGVDSMLGHVFRIIDAIPGYWDREYFAHSRQLHDGTLAASELYSRIAASPNTASTVDDAPIPWTKILNAEEGTNGVTINTTDTPGITSVSIGGTSAATYANDQTHNGTLAYKFAPSATTDVTNLNIPLDSSLEQTAEFWVRFSAIPTTSDIRLFTFRNSGGTALFLLLQTTGKLRTQNSATTTLVTSTTTIATGAWLKIQVHAVVGASTSTGACEVRIYNGYGQLLETMASTGTNLGTTPLVNATIGKSNANATGNTPVIWVDDLGIAAPRRALVAAVTGATSTVAARYAFIASMSGATVPATSLTVSLGGDVQGIEPYTTQTLTASVSSGLAVLSIEQTLGPSVVLISGVGPTWTYRTPGVLDAAGAQVRFRVTATLSGTTVSDEVDHFIYPNCWGYYDSLGRLQSAEVTDVPAVVGPPPSGDDTFTDLWVDTF